jgi:hypothetical protein
MDQDDKPLVRAEKRSGDMGPDYWVLCVGAVEIVTHDASERGVKTDAALITRELDARAKRAARPSAAHNADDRETSHARLRAERHARSTTSLSKPTGRAAGIPRKR